jgi:hypothetical protein
MGRSKEKQAREEAEARARKDKKKDSGDVASDAVEAVGDATAPAKDKKRSKRSKDLPKEDDIDAQQASLDTAPDAAAASEADIEGIERRRAREEAKLEKEEKKGRFRMTRVGATDMPSSKIIFVTLGLSILNMHPSCPINSRTEAAQARTQQSAPPPPNLPLRILLKLLQPNSPYISNLR